MDRHLAESALDGITDTGSPSRSSCGFKPILGRCRSPVCSAGEIGRRAAFKMRSSDGSRFDSGAEHATQSGTTLVWLSPHGAWSRFDSGAGSLAHLWDFTILFGERTDILPGVGFTT